MFIDLCPGTPRPYRKPMFDRLLFAGFRTKTNLLYATDNSVGPYDSEYANNISEYDESIFDGYYADGGMFGIKLDDDFREYLYYKNAIRFIGLPENY
jgi:hypothetical protein